LRSLFRWLDAVMQRANRLFGGFAFRSRDRALPEDDPIAWRELTRTTLGRPHYLARLLVALEFLTVALCLWAVIEDGGGPTAKRFHRSPRPLALWRFWL
jgi:hypothetical protein